MPSPLNALQLHFIWRNTCGLDTSLLSHKLNELFCCQLQFIVGDDLFEDAVMCKQNMQRVDALQTVHGAHWDHF